MQQIADAEILHLNRAMDRYINISAAIEDHLMENRDFPGDYMRNLYFYSMSQSLREIEIQTAPDGQVRPIYPQSGSVLSGFNLSERTSLPSAQLMEERRMSSSLNPAFLWQTARRVWQSSVLFSWTGLPINPSGATSW